MDETKLRLGTQILKRRYQGLYSLLESMVSKNNVFFNHLEKISSKSFPHISETEWNILTMEEEKTEARGMHNNRNNSQNLGFFRRASL